MIYFRLNTFCCCFPPLCRYTLFIEKIHKRPKDRLGVQGGVAPFGGSFHLNKLLVHLFHAVLNHWFKTVKCNNKSSILASFKSMSQTLFDTKTHLEPNTPLSSSSTVLSLFCSSFRRSLASASSCKKPQAPKMFALTVENYVTLKDPSTAADLLLGREHQVQKSSEVLHRWPPPHSAGHLCRATL